MTPGIHALSHRAYHADPCPTPSLSAGAAITLLSQSPAHAWAAHPRNPKRIARAATRAMDRGSLMHEMLVGEGAGIAVIEADSYRSKAAQEARDAAYADGLVPVLAHEHAEAQAALDEIETTLATHEMLAMLAGHEVQPEASMTWLDGDVWCRARPDNLFADLGVIVDFKFTGKSALAWADAAFRRLDHVRAAHYLHGLRAITGARDPRYLFVVCEVDPPYGIVVHEFDGAALEIAERSRQRAVATWGECLSTGRWPSYPQAVNLMMTPAWAMRELEEVV